ncbi:hypothetical protein CGCF413_v014560 [Colletotrichum fructicola]|nr:hypothetical protein CGCF413_v014560 [Colletotrichum fructicola]
MSTHQNPNAELKPLSAENLSTHLAAPRHSANYLERIQEQDRQAILRGMRALGGKRSIGIEEKVAVSEKGMSPMERLLGQSQIVSDKQRATSSHHATKPDSD